MGFFDNKDNVEQYIKMCEGYDNSLIIKTVRENIEAGYSILELGMGPGKDMDSLKELYKITGSDMSQIFLDRYIEQHPDADLLILDAVNLQTERKFDSIFSNKVLHHLSEDQLQQSIIEQYRVLNKNGVLLHTFWAGEGQEDYEGMTFNYYNEDKLEKLFGIKFKVEMFRYSEMENNDSIFVICRKEEAK